MEIQSKQPMKRPHNYSRRSMYNLRKYETKMLKKRKIGWLIDLYWQYSKYQSLTLFFFFFSKLRCELGIKIDLKNFLNELFLVLPDLFHVLVLSLIAWICFRCVLYLDLSTYHYEIIKEWVFMVRRTWIAYVKVSMLFHLCLVII